MNDQISIFDWMDEAEPIHYCKDCVNANFKFNDKEGNPFWWCNIARAYITIHSFDWLCKQKGGCFERRKYSN